MLPRPKSGRIRLCADRSRPDESGPSATATARHTTPAALRPSDGAERAPRRVAAQWAEGSWTRNVRKASGRACGSTDDSDMRTDTTSVVPAAIVPGRHGNHRDGPPDNRSPVAY